MSFWRSWWTSFFSEFNPLCLNRHCFPEAFPRQGPRGWGGAGLAWPPIFVPGTWGPPSLPRGDLPKLGPTWGSPRGREDKAGGVRGSKSSGGEIRRARCRGCCVASGVSVFCCAHSHLPDPAGGLKRAVRVSVVFAGRPGSRNARQRGRGSVELRVTPLCS